jgi:hypothetical protein
MRELLKSGGSMSVLLAAMPALVSAPPTTDLGKPMNIASTAVYFPISGFHRIHASPSSSGKTRVLFIGGQGTSFDAINMERWPLVKALTRFGRLTGVKRVNSQCHAVAGSEPFCSVPTFDLVHADLHSSVVTFTDRELIRESGTKYTRYQSLDGTDKHLFDTYARYRGVPQCYSQSHQPKSYACPGYVNVVLSTIGATDTQRTLPLVLVGQYVQTFSQIITLGDFRPMAAIPVPSATPSFGGDAGSVGAYRFLGFSQIQNALIKGRDPVVPGARTRVVEDVNAEANVITALICKSDGNRPHGVCSDRTIKGILRHLVGA